MHVVRIPWKGASPKMNDPQYFGAVDHFFYTSANKRH